MSFVQELLEIFTDDRSGVNIQLTHYFDDNTSPQDLVDTYIAKRSPQGAANSIGYVYDCYKGAHKAEFEDAIILRFKEKLATVDSREIYTIPTVSFPRMLEYLIGAYSDVEINCHQKRVCSWAIRYCVRSAYFGARTPSMADNCKGLRDVILQNPEIVLAATKSTSLNEREMEYLASLGIE